MSVQKESRQRKQGEIRGETHVLNKYNIRWRKDKADLQSGHSAPDGDTKVWDWSSDRKSCTKHHEAHVRPHSLIESDERTLRSNLQKHKGRLMGVKLSESKSSFCFLKTTTVQSVLTRSHSQRSNLMWEALLPSLRSFYPCFFNSKVIKIREVSERCKVFNTELWFKQGHTGKLFLPAYRDHPEGSHLPDLLHRHWPAAAALPDRQHLWGKLHCLSRFSSLSR